MKTLHPSSQFKKDVKRIKNNPRKLEKLQEVLKMLATEVQLPENTKRICSRATTKIAWNATLKGISY